jgi:hypothetical protein
VPRIGGVVFRYRLHTQDGGDLGEATYAVMIKPGEEILFGNGRRLRVLDVVPFEEEDESRSSDCCRSKRRSADLAVSFRRRSASVLILVDLDD